MSEVFNPGSTYRIQFHKDFGFRHLEAIIPYLDKLGIQTLYASPIFKAFPGSNHGYDGTDPNEINPEIGTEAELDELIEALRTKGIHWIQDIVPNHLAYHSDNKWLMDVLENGSGSDKANYFDIDWHHPVQTGKVMAPFLGAALEAEIRNGNLKLLVNPATKKYRLNYFNNEFPINNASTQFLQDQPVSVSTSQDDRQIIELNEQTLKKIVESQYYELCAWFETDKRINFRRFFTVNGLICTNIQHPQVFEDYHRLVRKLVEKKIFRGLRIDHVDGLYDPGKYLHDLRKIAGEQTYIVVEKILAHNEELPSNWPIQGTSGYDFLAMVNNVMTNRESEGPLSEFYHRLIQDAPTIHEEIIKKKSHILFHYMHGELDNLTRLYQQIVDPALQHKDVETLKADIAQYLIHCRVYRFYEDIPVMKRDEAKNRNIIQPFYQRCMQFTGPLMAKGVEDTLMYTYNRFIGHNDVGDSPEYFGADTEEFHRQMKQRQSLWPMALNTTSTHDTKRGEDARARLNAVTDLCKEWTALCSKWIAENASLKTQQFPDVNDEYFVYQTLISTYPFAEGDFESYLARLGEYFPKAFREGKINSNWANPAKDYEDATAQFVKRLFENEQFRKSFFPFLDKIKSYGVLNSLVQSVLKFTCPGIPDLYQGTEGWDLSLVDPDNRRPVDYPTHVDALQISGRMEELWKSSGNGKIKIQLIQKLLSLRKEFVQLFLNGSYSPLGVSGILKQYILAFERNYKTDRIIVIVPLNIAKLAEAQNVGLLEIDWMDTKVDFKNSGELTDIISETEVDGADGLIIRDIFRDFPIAVLKSMRSPA